MDILSVSPSPNTIGVSNTTLDLLPAHSHAFVLACEEIIASLYAPQNPSTLASTTSALADAINRLRATLIENALLPPPRTSDVDQLAAGAKTITVSAGGPSNNERGGGKNDRDSRKWFDTCFVQIEKLYAALDRVLSPRNET